MNDKDGVTKMTTDEEVLKLSVKKPAYFSVLLDRYQGKFLAKAKRMLANHDEAEDVVQETFIKIYTNAERFETQDGASFRSWAYKILINTTLTRYRKIKQDQVVFLSPEMEEVLEDGREEGYKNISELSNIIASILVRIPRRSKRLITAFFLDDKTHKEIAATERLSLTAAKTALHRAKKDFKRVAVEIDPETYR